MFSSILKITKRVFLGLFSVGGLILGTLGMSNDDPWTGALGIVIAGISLFFLLRAVWDLIGIAVKALIITFLFLVLLFFTGGMEFLVRPLPDEVKAFIPKLADKYPDKYDGRIAVDTADTVIIQGKKFKLYGIRTPSLTQNCYNVDEQPYQCGQQALDALKGFADDRVGTCYLKEKDVAQCFIDRKDISRFLIENGYGQKTADEYADAEMLAKDQKRGIWQGKFMLLPGKASKKAKGAFSSLFNLL